MKMLENLQDDFDFNYKTLKSAGGMASKVKRFQNPQKRHLFLVENLCVELFSRRIVPGPEWKQPGSSYQAEDGSAGADAECFRSAKKGETHYNFITISHPAVSGRNDKQHLYSII